MCQAVSALPAVQAIASTLPPPTGYAGTLPPATCADACAVLGGSGLAAAVGVPSMALCTQAGGSAAAQPGQLADSAALGAAVLDVVTAGLGADAAAALRGATGGAMTPAQALAADALVGSLRVRNPEDGWARVDAGAPCLTFPQDHGLHVGMADEWYFVVGVLTARGAGETADTRISFCWMLDFRLVKPAAHPPALSAYIVDAQFAVAEEGAPNVALAAPLWGSATPLRATASPRLHVEAGGMSLREVAASTANPPPPDGLGTLQLRAANAARGTLLAATLSRNPAVAPLVLEEGRGVIGDAPNGNGNYYYSAPFLSVAPGGAVVTLDAAGKATPRTITGGVAWYDHQLGTIGRPASWGQAALWQLLAAAAPTALPIVDRGFGIAGQENWFGLMWTAGPLAGTAFMGTVISLAPAAKLSGATVAGNWILPDGAGGARVVAVSGTVSATATITDGEGASSWASAFSLQLPSPPLSTAPTAGIRVAATNLAADGFMTWSKGDTYSEAALVLAASDGSTGYGWAEQVGWDTQSTAKLLGTLGITQKSAITTSAWERAPSAFAAGGYWMLAGLALVGLLILVLAGAGAVKAAKAVFGKGKAAPLSAAPPVVAPPAPPPFSTSAPLSGALSGGYLHASKPSASAVNALVARWMQN